MILNDGKIIFDAIGKTAFFLWCEFWGQQRWLRTRTYFWNVYPEILIRSLGPTSKLADHNRKSSIGLIRPFAISDVTLPIFDLKSPFLYAKWSYVRQRA